MFLLVAVSLFFTNPAPLDMPRAEAFLVSGGGEAPRLEDRYPVCDLWTSRAVIGRWMDDESRVFTLARLDELPPPVEESEPVTRAEYAKRRVALDPKDDEKALLDSVSRLSPVDLPEEPMRLRQLPRSCRDVRFYQGTNEHVIVCAYWPEKSAKEPDGWRLAVWELADEDDDAESLKLFVGEYLEKLAKAIPVEVRAADAEGRLPKRTKRTSREEPSERELQRADARHSVAAYRDWHASAAQGYEILDALPRRSFVAALTNELPAMHAKYAATVPSPLDGSNVLCVARLYANRDDYLAAVGDDMQWSAAYWSQERREIVAYLPQRGEDELLRTFRHEAFHQYLSYAAAMVPASPWFNEGYAEYFEDDESESWDLPEPMPDFDRLAEAIPALLALDYRGFYGGTDLERRIRYRLAWSIARFIEKGAPLVRFQPFKNLKRDYLVALLKEKDMRLATAAAFGSKENLDLFVSEWKKYWKMDR